MLAADGGGVELACANCANVAQGDGSYRKCVREREERVGRIEEEGGRRRASVLKLTIGLENFTRQSEMFPVS